MVEVKCLSFAPDLQGVTMKPLVKWLKVKQAFHSEVTLVEKLQNRVNF